VVAWVTVVVGVGAIGASQHPAHASDCDPAKQGCFSLASTIAFSSTRDNPGAIPPFQAAEIYLLNPDGSDPRRLTDNTAGDGFPNLSPDGKTIVFDSSRLTGLQNVSDLFLMETDGSEQTLLTRGSSATWSPDGKEIAFHASASYYASGGLVTGDPIRPDPGSATTDSDIFVANVDDLLAGTAQPTNITNTPDQIEDDADWSSVPTSAPQGQSIVFTSHAAADTNQSNPTDAELYVMNQDGSGRLRLTDNSYEDRAPSWSPDGTRIAYSCRSGGTVFHICVINADGTGFQQLTNAAAGDLTASWSPDGQQILFHRNLSLALGGPQLFVIDASGLNETKLTCPTGGTCPAPLGGINLIAHWGQLRVHSKH